MFEHLTQDWQDCISAFLASRRTHWIQQAAQSALSSFFRGLSTPPTEVTQADIVAFLAAPGRAGTLTRNARQRYLTHLQDFFEFASTWLVNGQPLYQKQPLPTTGIRSRLFAPALPATHPFAHLPQEWQEVIAVYLAGIRNISGSEKSYESYRSVLAQFFRNRPGSPADVTKSEVLRFINSPSTSPRNKGAEASASTKNGRRTVLHTLYKFASDYDLPGGGVLFDKALPTRGIRNLKRAHPYRNMSTDEIKAFFAAIDRASLKGKRDFALFWSYFLTARRLSELVGLRLGDITQTVFIEKDGTQRPGYQYQYVRKGHQREIAQAELDVSAYTAIMDYLHAAGRLPAMRPTDPIFVPLRPGQGREDGATDRPIAGATVNYLFKAYCRKAGLPVERLSTHSLRHASAHQRELAGQTVYEISEALGHADVAITFRYLAQLHSKSDHGQASLAQRFTPQS